MTPHQHGPGFPMAIRSPRGEIIYLPDLPAMAMVMASCPHSAADRVPSPAMFKACGRCGSLEVWSVKESS